MQFLKQNCSSITRNNVSDHKKYTILIKNVVVFAMENAVL